MQSKKNQALTSELRNFGLLVGFLTCALFGGFIPYLFKSEISLVPWIIGGALIFSGLLFPTGLRPFYRFWIRLSHALGFVNTRIILGAVFFVMFVPFSFILWVLRKDPLARKWDEKLDSYRVKSRVNNIEQLERPY